ncbi:ribonuclease III [Anaeroplasma bactoclasticum]|uniref:ribonuclease III n=1 Tax=Anaeroplasma bactoclasticum TaxID=2088 RepID=UPI00319E798D
MRKLNNIEEFEGVIGYTFKDKSLLETALTHSSYANEHGKECNERMEFLGDAVLELAMSKYLYAVISLDEGVLTKTRAKAVCEGALDYYAAKINLPKYLYLGKGEEISGGRFRPAIIADAMEAVLGAVFLDSGFDEAYKIVKTFFIPYIDEVTKLKDYKSLLQEKLQSEKRTIRYEIVRDEGPANDKEFEAVVYMDEILMGRGIGKTKKEAQQNAAKNALEKEAKI